MILFYWKHLCLLVSCKISESNKVNFGLLILVGLTSWGAGICKALDAGIIAAPYPYLKVAWIKQPMSVLACDAKAHRRHHRHPYNTLTDLQAISLFNITTSFIMIKIKFMYMVTKYMILESMNKYFPICVCILTSKIIIYITSDYSVLVGRIAASQASFLHS